MVKFLGKGYGKNSKVSKAVRSVRKGGMAKGGGIAKGSKSRGGKLRRMK